jgi:GNAT superfamily N-acetyltransferase
MTFPVYRPLLALAPAVRHPEQGDAKPIQPIAFVARLKGAPVGLVLGELPLSVVGSAEMLSLFVAPDWRNRGIGRTLVARLEEEVARRGQVELIATYTSGKPSIAAVERILWKRGWEAPETRTLSVRFTPQAGLTAAVFEEKRMAALTAGLELFSWADLSPEEKRAIRVSQQRSPWITPALAPWRFEGGDLDLVSSIGARTVGAPKDGSGPGGEVVGWVLNHHASPGVVRFTCSFLRKDFSRRGRIVPLYRESLRRLAATDCRLCTFVTPVEYDGMIAFIQRWIAPVAEFLAETRGSRKRLVPPKGSSPLDAPAVGT